MMRITIDRWRRADGNLTCLFRWDDRRKGGTVLSTNWILSSVHLYCDLPDTGYITVTEAQMANGWTRKKYDKH